MPESALCRHCRLCCDGTLFTHAPLTDDEALEAPRIGLPVVTRANGRPGIAQPCTANTGRGCTVYIRRPSACRAFRCHLLDALRSDEVSLADAKALVDDARRARGSPEGKRLLAQYFVGQARG